MAKRRVQTQKNRDLVPSTAVNLANSDLDDRGPKLDDTQRGIVDSVIALYHDVTMVQEVLAEQHPEVPALSERAIRYRRQRLEKDITAAAKEARQAALTAGLALKATRILHLTRLYQQLRRGLVVKRETVTDPKTGALRTVEVINPTISQQMQSVLAQIAKETGAETPGAMVAIQLNTGSSDTPPSPSTSPELVADLKRQLGNLIQGIAERRAAALLAESGLPVARLERSQ